MMKCQTLAIQVLTGASCYELQFHAPWKMIPFQTARQVSGEHANIEDYRVGMCEYWTLYGVNMKCTLNSDFKIINQFITNAHTDINW